MSDKVLVLRTNPADGSSYGGFTWPESGPVEAPDWNDRAECGGGLHGLLWGCGHAGLLHDPGDVETVWRVVEVDAGSVVDLGGKVKFPRGVVAFCGDRNGALSYLDAHGASDKPVAYATRVGGNYSTVTGGDGATVTGGNYSTVTGGYGATVTGGDGATVTGGDGATVTGGNYSTVLIARWDGVRRRIATGYIGEDGLLPNVPYRLDNEGRFIRADR